MENLEVRRLSYIASVGPMESRVLRRKSARAGEGEGTRTEAGVRVM